MDIINEIAIRMQDTLFSAKNYFKKEYLDSIRLEKFSEQNFEITNETF